MVLVMKRLLFWQIADKTQPCAFTEVVLIYVGMSFPEQGSASPGAL